MDGPVSGCVQKIVAAELRGKLAVTPRLRMVAGLASATQLAHATRKLVQVWLVDVNECGCLFCLSSMAYRNGLI